VLGNQATKQYFATGTSHYVTPSVSAEWNYNLFYSPYATFAGTGTNLSTDFLSWTWTNAPAQAVSAGKNGATALRFSGVGADGHGSTKTTVTVPSGKNTYKVIFYAKIDQAVDANITAITYLDFHRSNSSSHTVDSTQWVKFETYISSLPSDTTYSQFDLTIDYTASDNTSSFTVLIDSIQIYQTTAFDYLYGNFWPTSSPFAYFRPGESYIPSGNSLTPLPTNFRKVNYAFPATQWRNQKMPISPVLYQPQLLGMGGSNPLFKNGILSEFSEYKYFVSDLESKSVGAVYEKEIDVNKIVLKFSNAYSTPTVNITFSNTVTNTTTTVTMNSLNINSAGICILYRQSNGTWSNAPWTTMPTFNVSGAITNSQKINKIVVTQTDASVNSNYSSSSERAQKDMKRLQVIEISPRLELDLTYFTMSVNTNIELDNKQNPLPISAISANNATIELSNVPLTVSNQVLSLFSNNSTSSPLKGLFRKNVKFYLNYIVRDSYLGSNNQPESSQNKVIPGGVFYAEEWQGQDIQRTQVTAFDISKQLQLRSPTDYVSQNQDVFTTISNILDFAGFTDYDYDSLKTVCADIISPYFFADGKQQKVWDVLRELFEAYQIGAYIDAYGVMKFLNLKTILTNTTATMALHDASLDDSSTVPGLRIASNIVQDTYTETVKAKIGKATIKYKVPQISKTLSADGSDGFGAPLSTNIIDKNDALWNLDKDEMTTFNYLYKDMSTVSQNYFNLNPDDLLNVFNSFNVGHDAYGMIEGEIVTFADKEFSFDVKRTDLLSGINSTSKYTAIVHDESDLKRAIAEYSSKSQLNGAVTYIPTGKICNVSRGLFNTPVRTHIVVDSINKFLTKMEKVGTDGGVHSVYDGAVFLDAPALPTFNNQYFTDTKSIYKPIGESSYSYNTFSTKLKIGPNSDYKPAQDIGGGLALNIGSNVIYVELRQHIKPISGGGTTRVYHLHAYKGNESNYDTTFFAEDFYIDVTSIIENEKELYPADSAFAEFGKTINLKFVKTSDNNFNIYLNKTKVSFTLKANQTIDVSGNFGIFAHSFGDSSSSVPFTELYATQMILDDTDHYYHYETLAFANTIVAGHKVMDINYMFQIRPQVVGINFYDVRYSTAPSITAYPLKVSGHWWYYEDPINNKTQLSKIDINENALNYSDIYHTGFGGKVAIINSSPSAVWLKKNPDSVNKVDFQFSINTKDLVILSDEFAIEKVFDETNLTESIEIRTNWMQSKKAAISVLNNVFKAIDGFSRDTSISVYGNPLYEIGDVVKINYSLKNISNQTYFVQGVQQTFDTGLKTVLILNEIKGSSTPASYVPIAPQTTQSGYLNPVATGKGESSVPAPSNVYFYNYITKPPYTDAQNHSLYMNIDPSVSKVNIYYDYVLIGFHAPTQPLATNYIIVDLEAGNHLVTLESIDVNNKAGGYSTYEINL
jgi:hypothetical protein